MLSAILRKTYMKSPEQKLRRKYTPGPLSAPAKQVVFIVLCFFLSGAKDLAADSGVLRHSAQDQRPSWLRHDGIVMAGSWEPLLFRVRRDGHDGYVPNALQSAAYVQEHSPQMIEKLKGLGVNFVMMHCYKGAGLVAEQQSMADAVKFAKLCHDAGLHVGVYTYSGAFLWEPLFKEVPQASDWVLLDENGKPQTYGSAAYRYYWNRNHPDAQAYYRKIVSFAVNKIDADLLHFDNYIAGPGCDLSSVGRFRQYLRDTFTDKQMKNAGIDDINSVRPAMTGPPDNLLGRAWLDFSCQSLADSYHQMSRYARTLRSDILIECNPGGPGSHIRPPIDHGRLLQGGEAFWDEGEQPGYHDGKLSTRIRTYKVARCINNVAFTYTTTPLEMAESMAFNRDCLGCICWFEYAKIVARPGSRDPISATPALGFQAPATPVARRGCGRQEDAGAPFIRFFHTRRDLFRDANVVTDVAVLRSFPSQVFADPKYAKLTYQVEQALIDNHVCFQIIYNQQLGDLHHYRALVLAGCVAVSDQHIKQIEQYVKSGGRVFVIGPLATHDEWMFPRTKPPAANLSDSQVVRIDENDDTMAAIRRVCDNKLTLSIPACPGLCCELTEQAGSGTRLVHLVNYRPDSIKDVTVTVRLPIGRNAKTVTLASPQRQNDIPLPFEAQDDSIKFTVPEVSVYEIATVILK
jgi:hypothetical protein